MSLTRLAVATAIHEERRLRLELLDGFQVTMAGQPVALPLGARRLVAFLALNRRWSQRGHIAGTLWPDTTADRASADVRSALWRVHHCCPALVEIRGDHLRLASDVDIDLREATALAQQIVAGDRIRSDREVSALCDARTLLPGWDDDWVQVERESFRQLRLHALEAACEGLASAGRFAAAVQAGLAARTDDPLRESARRVLIKAYVAEGNPAEALREYRSSRCVLSAELHIRPSTQMEELMRSLGLDEDDDRVTS